MRDIQPTWQGDDANTVDYQPTDEDVAFINAKRNTRTCRACGATIALGNYCDESCADLEDYQQALWSSTNVL